MGYYLPSGPMTIKEIVERWQAGDKMYDSAMPLMLPIEEVFKYRDYDWTRKDSRPGNGHFYESDEYNAETDISGTHKWDSLVQSLQKHGWDKKFAAMLFISKDGKAKLGEGNHRLAVARLLGMTTIPVQVFFYHRVTQTSEAAYEPRQVA